MDTIDADVLVLCVAINSHDIDYVGDWVIISPLKFSNGSVISSYTL